MSTKYSGLFSPGRIGNLDVGNRVVMAPMATSFASATGEVTQWMVDYYVERARGGVGIIIVENANVDYPRGMSGTTQLRIDKDSFVPSLLRLTQAIHAEGALCALQLNHAGAVARKATQEQAQPVAPSKGPNDLYPSIPKPLTIKELLKIIDFFAQAARRAQKAGFDAVEIHGAHAYLIAEFLSPLTNRRKDMYGGDLKGRSRFACETLGEVRRAVGPEFPIIFRLDASEFLEGGIELEESIGIVSLLLNEGVDAVDLSVGTHYRINRSLCSQIEPMSYEQGWRLDLVEEVKKKIDIPVIAVGPFREPGVAENAIKEGKVDFVALGRALIADPEWPVKAQQGREDEIRHCISCNEGCIRPRLFEDQPVSCAVNPEVGWEGLGLTSSADQTKRLMVVGGGPAGCTAAIYARHRGHEVVLLERNGELGGKCLVGSRQLNKEKLGWVVTHQRKRLEELEVEIRLETSFSVSLVEQVRPDLLVLAIGAEPCIPQDIEIKAIETLHAETLLREGISWSKAHVAVIGGGALGCELALALANANNKVTVLEALEQAARGIEPISRFDLLEKVGAESRIDLLTNTKVRWVDGTKILYEINEGRNTLLNVDFIVWATGYRPRRLQDLPIEDFPELEIRLIGDCLRPRNIFHAVRDGFWLGVKV